MPKPARWQRALPGILASSAFTIIELLIVMAVIIILAGLILVAAGYVREKGYRSRAEAEIAAISAAVESYRVDNGVYPRETATDTLTAVTDQAFSSKNPPDPKPTGYEADPRKTSALGVPDYNSASFTLYAQLSGNLDGDRTTVAGKGYFQFKPNMLYPANGSGTVVAVVDPWGNTYGFSTAKTKHNEDPATPDHGFNPTFDFWSTANTHTAAESAYEVKWIRNW